MSPFSLSSDINKPLVKFDNELLDFESSSIAVSTFKKIGR